MKKKMGLIIGWIIGVIVLLAIVFFFMDQVLKIGPWWIKEEGEIGKKTSQMKGEETKRISLEELPFDYTKEQAIQDGCFVIGVKQKDNLEKMEDFLEGKIDFIRMVQYTIEGDMIVTDIQHDENQYKIRTDFTRDKFATEQDRKIVEKTYDANKYEIVREQKDETVMIWIQEKGTKGKEGEELCSYPENVNSFFGTIIEAQRTYLIVEPEEGEQIRSSSDKFSISLGEDNDMMYQVGTKVKVTHTGFIRETYPAQLDVIDIEIKSTDEFNLIFRKEETKQKKVILEKQEGNNVYSIYSYAGDVSLQIKGQTLSLREALLNRKITIGEILKEANQALQQQKIKGDFYQDGGSALYRYDTYTIVKLHTLDGKRDVFIGPPEMTIEQVYKL